MDKVDEQIYEDIRKIQRDRRNKPVSPAIVIMMILIATGTIALFIRSGSLDAPTGLVTDDRPLGCYFANVRMSAASAGHGIICNVRAGQSGTVAAITNNIMVPTQTPIIVESVSVNNCTSAQNATILYGQTQAFILEGCRLKAIGNKLTLDYKNLETSLSYSLDADLR